MTDKPPIAPKSARQPKTGDRRWTTPLASRQQKRVLVVFLLLWCLSVARFGWWWLDPTRQVGLVGLTMTSAIIGFTMLLPAWIFFVSFRASRPRPDLSFGAGRVAMIVTKAPSEPWTMVRHTLVAMLHQDHELPYDVWLADEDPSAETLAWCKKRGVRVSSRHNVPSYHRSSWPRRTRSKEGNLAYFYDQWGYRHYDVVCQFDADHVPRPDYLRTILRGFSDPRVGYVAAPSICSAESQDSWTARGRLHKEANLHGLLQAGHNDGYGPTCIGSHYAVRTQALKDIGGVGPELAEDFSTSFLLAAHGWRGVFDIEAIAEGEGPHTFVDGMTQELQWARSLTTVGLRYSRGHWKNLRPTERFRFGFALCWYPLFVAHLGLAFLLAPLAIVLAKPWVSVTLIGFFAHASVPTMVVVALMIFLRRQRWFRPDHAPVVSWEAALFHLTRWPWNLLGIIQSVIGAIRGRELDFRVTPKTRDGDVRPLPVGALIPSLVLVMLQSGTVLALGDRSRPFGYLVLATAAGLIYAGVTAAVFLLHLVEDDAPMRRGLRASAGAGVVAASAILLSVAAGYRTISIALGSGAQRPMNLERMESQLLGTQHLTGGPFLIYLISAAALVAYAVWDRRTTDEQWWLRETLDQLQEPSELDRRPMPVPRQLRHLSPQEPTQSLESSEHSSIATSSSGP